MPKTKIRTLLQTEVSHQVRSIPIALVLNNLSFLQVYQYHRQITIPYCFNCSVKYPKENNTKQRQQTNRKTESKDTLKIKKKRNPNNSNNSKSHTYTQSQASYSLQHILHRRYYLAITQMTSARKAYIPCLFGIIIKRCHMINMKSGINISTVVTKE